MGADMCIQWVVIKDGKEEESKKKIIEAINKFEIPELNEDIKNKILTKLDSKHSKNFDEFIYFWEDGMFKDTDDNNMPTEDDEDLDEGVLSISRAREIMNDVVKETFDSLNCRDVTYIQRNGETMYLSGGVSWGDSPTDSYDLFSRFNSLPQSILKEGDIE